MLFHELADFDAGQEHVVVMCVKCQNAGVKARIEAMTDKSVVRSNTIQAGREYLHDCNNCKHEWVEGYG